MRVDADKGSMERLAKLETQLESLRHQLAASEATRREETRLALNAAEKAIQIAQETADRAVAKAEASAAKEYLEAQIKGLRDTFGAQIISQKEAITAALSAAREALTAALQASEKAIQKAEVANEKRFESVNEFRAQLNDQAKQFMVRNEAELRFAAIEKQYDEKQRWRNTVDVRFSEYMTNESFQAVLREWQDWRRQVEGNMHAQAGQSMGTSKVGIVIAATIAAAAGVATLVAVAYNIMTKH